MNATTVAGSGLAATAAVATPMRRPSGASCPGMPLTALAGALCTTTGCAHASVVAPGNGGFAEAAVACTPRPVSQRYATSTRPFVVAASSGATWLPAPAASIRCAGPYDAPLVVDIAANTCTFASEAACQATTTRPPAAMTLGVGGPTTPLTSDGAVASPTTVLGPTRPELTPQ